MVGPENAGNSGFDGQAFFNPGAGDVGNLPINYFDGPSQFVTDLAVSKRVRFGRDTAFQVRADIFNLFNTVNWNFGDIDINSTTAGRITGTGGARLVQFSVRLDF